MQYRSGGPNESRNVIIAIALSLAIFVGFEFFYNMPQRARIEAERARVEAQQGPTESARGSADALAATAPADREGMIADTAAARVSIETPSLEGSLSLQGARLDDLSLRGYRRSVDPDSEVVTLLSPMGSQFGHDAFFGWEMRRGEESAATLADAFSGWTLAEGARLTPSTPVTLTLPAGEGLMLERTIAVDENYMFTIADTLHNRTERAVQVRPFGTVRRQGMPQDYIYNGIVHQGLIGAFGPNDNLHQVNFKNADKHARDRERGRVGESERALEQQGEGGWLGITDHYWLAAIAPDQGERISAYFDSRPENGENDYRAAYRGQWREAPAGGSVTYTQRLFAGAKRVEVLRDYQQRHAIPRFDDAVDWGNFWFLTRPFFALLHWFGQIFAGWGIAYNFGLAILASTVVIKALLFPLVYQSFKAMAKMRALQPKMKEIQERYAADKQRQQQEILKLYQTEKINPVSGCVPILLQIPVFYALYKVLTVTIEMRHAPFYGWINDLSARDPTSLFNLFGLFPYEVPALLMIGAWPILYGVSMWALQALSPPPADPMQAQIFRFLPILFTVMFAAFPAGLVIYWTWSNSLSIAQQYVIMRRQGVETQLDKFLAKRFGREPTAAE